MQQDSKNEKYSILDLSKSPDSILHIIDQQWKDVHHSRNQDWMYWAILGAMITGIFITFSNRNNFNNIYSWLFALNILILSVGFVSFWAAKISWSHWLLHIRKIEYIKWLRSLFFLRNNGIKIKIYPQNNIIPPELISKDKYIVNGLIYSMYFTIGIFSLISSIGSIVYYLFFVQIDIELKKYILIGLPLLMFGLSIFFLKIIHKVNKKQLKYLRDHIKENYNKYYFGSFK